jgi:hypothetical protein
LSARHEEVALPTPLGAQLARTRSLVSIGGSRVLAIPSSSSSRVPTNTDAYEHRCLRTPMPTNTDAYEHRSTTRPPTLSTRCGCDVSSKLTLLAALGSRCSSVRSFHKTAARNDRPRPIELGIRAQLAVAQNRDGSAWPTNTGRLVNKIHSLLVALCNHPSTPRLSNFSHIARDFLLARCETDAQQ